MEETNKHELEAARTEAIKRINAFQKAVSGMNLE